MAILEKIDMYQFRQELAGRKINTLVIKVGSNVVAKDDFELRYQKINEITADIAELHNAGIKVVLISSGAIAAGASAFKVQDKDRSDLAYLQAAAAVGQPLLMSEYRKVFSPYNIKTAQILLTKDTFVDSERHTYLNNTLNSLLSNNIVPIINENDSVAVAEITFGDNDPLAALTAKMIQADLLVFISNADGVFTLHPKNSGAKQIQHISDLNIYSKFDFNNKSSLGRGGMQSKMIAIQEVFNDDIPVILAGKDFENPVARALKQISGTFIAKKNEHS